MLLKCENRSNPTSLRVQAAGLTSIMDTRQKVLLVDDEPDLLQMYGQILTQLPSKPEIRTASSGSRAMAMLESEPYRLLISDLKMPKMDGLQVLSIVRRKYPQLRTVALTSVVDEHFRARAYALGVDLFWQKPATEQEINLFLECLESLLGPETDNGFRGIQSKSLVDIIQLECISQSSSVLRITNGQSTGKVWIQDGEVIDSEAGELVGEAAFQRISSWRAGHFETLPPEPSRPRTIFKSYSGLLLESAQAIDESRSAEAQDALGSESSPALTNISRVDGVEFVLLLNGKESQPASRGLENPTNVATWAKETLQSFQSVGERLQAGPVQHLHCFGIQRNVALSAQGEKQLCVGWQHSLSRDQIREGMKRIEASWVS